MDFPLRWENVLHVGVLRPWYHIDMARFVIARCHSDRQSGYGSAVLTTPRASSVSGEVLYTLGISQKTFNISVPMRRYAKLKFGNRIFMQTLCGGVGNSMIHFWIFVEVSLAGSFRKISVSKERRASYVKITAG